jgi:predicted acyltransferase
MSISPSRRLESLDALRGLTIAAMLLVNNPGSWSHIYWPLEHAAWNGWTLTDLIFPFFLFMVGVAMMYSFPKRLSQGASRSDLLKHVARRALALMILGWWGASWSRILWPGSDVTGAPAIVLRFGFVALVLGAVVLLAGTSRTRVWWSVFISGMVLFLASAALLGFDDALLTRLANIRIPGVLVRIGWVYLLASGIYFLTPTREALIRWIVGLLLAYAVWMLLVPIPGFGLPDLSRGFPSESTPLHELFSNWAFFIDYHVLGSHTWGVRQLSDSSGSLIWSFDPEGIISTIPATCSVLFGILTGLWMRRKDLDDSRKLNGLFVAASWLMVLGLVMSIWMPINKRLWTSSYTVFTAGMALLTMAALYHAIDMKGFRRWAYPFVAYGRNAIFAFVLSGMMAVTLGSVRVGGDMSLKSWIYNSLPGSPEFASFLFGILFVAFWAGVSWIMDKKRIYFKV